MLLTLYVVGSVLVAVLVAVIVLAGIKRRIATTQGLIVWARTNGWTFTAVDQTIPTRFPGTPAARAVGGYAQKVLSGTVGGRPALVFQCSVEQGRGTDFTVTTVLAISLPASVPPLTVHLEGRRDLVARDLGFRDIEFENDAFNRRYKIECPERNFAYDVLNPRMIEWLMQASAPEWQITGSDLVLWHPGALTVPILQADLAFADGLLNAIPPFVWQKAHGR